jgi:hypothetical protein
MSSFVQSCRFTVFFAIYVLPCNQTCGPISGAYVNKNFSRSRQYGLAAHTERSCREPRPANKIARMVWGVLHGGRNFEMSGALPAGNVTIKYTGFAG